VQDLVDDDGACTRLREVLRHVADLERLTARCVQGIATPRDLGLIRDTLGRLSDVHGALEGLAAGELVSLRARCSEPPGLRERLAALLVDSPPASAREGGSIRAGADPELDSLLAASSDARTFIAGLEDAERRRTGIRSLRVGYNRVFGYYIEVPNAHGASVPDSYVRKQTLVGAERYITADLKEHESIVLHARERSVAREVELLEGAAALVAGEATALLACAGALAELDVAQSLARAAVEHRWTRPALDGSADLEVEDGRHPLVEASLGPGRFVPNDCRLGSEQRILVLTGPNMAGKSTYLRQVASIVLLAQVGSFVPARRARVGLCDRIFTRVGAHDDLSGGMSTFMVEMSETAAILRQASGRSLVVLDEIGRGTSTYDGLSIAQAVVEHIHDAPHLSCRTLFATHFHELTALAGRLPRVVNARIEVVEEGDHVTFLHRIAPGGADRSYGVHVAKLAGVPSSVLLRARQILAELQRVRPLAPADGAGGSADQMALPIPVERAPGVVEELAGLDVDTLTPIAALNKLADLHRQARG
jgi:DNA mismatch repair protein MutS